MRVGGKPLYGPALARFVLDDGFDDVADFARYWQRHWHPDDGPLDVIGWAPIGEADADV